MTNPRKGVFVFDMGQNISGWAQLRALGPRGTAVRMRYAETLYPNGMIDRENLRQAKARDIYMLRGGKEEIYEPHFTYHGFRYVEVTGYPGTPSINSLRGRVVHTAVRVVGSFAASTPILNDLQRAVVWTQLTNLFSIPTDCDQRDERQGWLGDAQLSAEEAMMNFDMAAFYTNFIRDIRDAQGPDGALPETVPEKYGQNPGDPAWESAYPLLCWYLWRQYGDRRVLEENYEGLKKFVGFLSSRAPDHVLRFNFNGDWIATVDTPGPIISDFYYYFDVTILRNVAKVLGKTADAKVYSELAQQIKTAFQENFFDPKTHQYLGRTQTAEALALYLDLLTPKERGSVSFDLEKNVHYFHDNHLTTGIIGTKYLLPALTATGRGDLAYKVAVQTTYPSWGYMLRNGASTIWEQWQKWSRAWMNSHDHPALASVGAWLYQSLGGITQGSDGAGYRHIRIAPLIVEGLHWASASVDTIRGTVACSWGHEPGKITVDATIPVNSDAQVVIPPEGDMTQITLSESGRVIWRAGRYLAGDEGVTVVRHEGGLFIVSVGSGHYSFELEGK